MEKLPDDLLAAIKNLRKMSPVQMHAVINRLYEVGYKAGYRDGEHDARKRYEDTAIILDIDEAVKRGINLEGLI